jgi:hypothetical protein
MVSCRRWDKTGWLSIKASAPGNRGFVVKRHKRPESKKDTTSQHGMMMSHAMMQEMSKVRGKCQETDRSAGTALSDLRAVKSSDDPKVLRPALDKAEKQLSEIQVNMTACLKRMNEMHASGQMQGGSHMKDMEHMDTTRTK